MTNIGILSGIDAMDPSGVTRSGSLKTPTHSHQRLIANLQIRQIRKEAQDNAEHCSHDLLQPEMSVLFRRRHDLRATAQHHPPEIPGDPGVDEPDA